VQVMAAGRAEQVWCEPCQSRSGLRWCVYLLHEDGPLPLFTTTECGTCPRMVA
jgi:hypothetical protein